MKFFRHAAFLFLFYVSLKTAFDLTFNSPFTTQDFFKNVIAGLFMSIVVAAINIISKRRQLKKIVLTLESDEVVIKEILASNVDNYKSAIGKLALTNKRIVFKASHALLERFDKAFALSEIQDASVGKSFLFTNILYLRADNVIHKFVVEKPGEWVEEINKQRSTL